MLPLTEGILIPLVLSRGSSILSSNSNFSTEHAHCTLINCIPCGKLARKCLLLCLSLFKALALNFDDLNDVLIWKSGCRMKLKDGTSSGPVRTVTFQDKY